MAFFKVTAFYGSDRTNFCIVGNFEAETSELAIFAARLTGRSKKGRLEAVEITKDQFGREAAEEAEHLARRARQAGGTSYSQKCAERKIAALAKNMANGGCQSLYTKAKKIAAEAGISFEPGSFFEVYEQLGGAGN